MKYKPGIVRGIVKLFTFKILLWPIHYTSGILPVLAGASNCSATGDKRIS